VKYFGARQLLITLLAAFALWGIVAIGCLCAGSTGFHWPTHEQMAIRRGSVLTASLIGLALGLAGVVYQAILRNPLADPYLLGVSSGATLAAYVWHLPIFGLIFGSSVLGIAAGEEVFAFAGALLAVGIVFLLAMRRGRLDPITLLLVGVIVNSINGALFLLLNAIYRDLPSNGGPLTFLVGGIQTNLTTAHQVIAAAIIFAGFAIILYLAGQLNVASTSDAEAMALGIRIYRLRWISLIAASLVTAAAVALSGPIGFIGLICPHVARLFVGSDQRRLIPISAALGAGLLAIADAASRALSSEALAQTILPVGVLTGLIGGPFFLFLLWRDRRRGNRGAI
jgi:iron complex transport system permease protein